jgi:hypothetical protein
MTNQYRCELFVRLIDPTLDDEEREQETSKLLSQLKQMDEVISAGRVRDPNPPPGTKSLGAFVVGLLMTEIHVSDALKVLDFISYWRRGKPIEIEAKVEDRSIKVSAYSKEELEAAITTVKSFFDEDEG